MASFLNWSNEGAQTLANSLSGLGQQFGQALEKQNHRQLLSDFTNKLATNDTQGALAMAGDLGDPNIALKLVESMKGEKALAALNGMQTGATGTTAPAAPLNTANLGNFGASANRVLGFEGADGKVTTDNNGAVVKYGINAAANPGVDVANLTKGQALQIYKKNYWDALGLDEVAKSNPALAHAAFDTAINAGPGKAKELMAASGGDANKLLDLRQQYNQQLIASDPNGKYGPAVQQSWTNRMNSLRQDIGGQPSGSGQQVGGDARAEIAKIDRMLQIPNLPESAKEQLKLRQAGLTRQVEWQYKDQSLPGATIDAQTQARMSQGQKLGLTGPALQSFALTGTLPKPGDEMTPAQKEMSTEYGKAAVAYRKDAASGNQTIAVLNQMDKLTQDPNFYSGTGSETIMKAKKLASTMGLTVPDGASANEVFDAMSKQLTLAANNGSLGPGVSNSDVAFLQSQNASLEHTPEGNRQLIANAKAVAQRKVEVSKMATAYIKQHGQLDAGFDEQLQEFADKNPMFKQAEAPKQEASKNVPAGFDTDLADLNRAIQLHPDRAQEFRDRFAKHYPGQKF